MIDYDLHIHSTYSDGVLTPRELFENAKQFGLKGLAITDHDTVDAIPDCKQLLLSDEFNLDFIPGIELSTEYLGQEIHILGYYIDSDNIELLKILNSFKTERYNRMIKMIARMVDLGYQINLEEVLETSGGGQYSLGRPHIARTLINKGYFKNMSEVFDKLLSIGKPGYIERFKVSTVEGIQLIKNFNGIPVLAHPGLIKSNYFKLEDLIQELKNNGLMGIEVFHTDHTIETSLALTRIAGKYSLLTTGGSDFHAPNSGRNTKIGSKGVTIHDVLKMKKIKDLI
jgi:3',5'-nucleoside bisphosphate phosphatase